MGKGSVGIELYNFYNWLYSIYDLEAADIILWITILIPVLSASAINIVKVRLVASKLVFESIKLVLFLGMMSLIAAAWNPLLAFPLAVLTSITGAKVFIESLQLVLIAKEVENVLYGPEFNKYEANKKSKYGIVYHNNGNGEPFDHKKEINHSELVAFSMIDNKKQ